VRRVIKNHSGLAATLGSPVIVLGATLYHHESLLCQLGIIEKHGKGNGVPRKILGTLSHKHAWDNMRSPITALHKKDHRNFVQNWIAGVIVDAT